MVEEYKMNIKSVVVGPTILAESLSNMNTMTDEQIYEIIKSSYSEFLSSYINSPCLLYLRRDSRFLSILSQVLMEADLTLEERVYANAMLYKELSETDNPYMQRVYFTLGLIVNQTVVNKIMAIGIDRTLAIYLAIVRKSSFTTKDNITRLNFTIMCATPKKMTVQKITDLYCVLFNDVIEIKDLFFLMIKDIYIFTSNEEWITSDILQVAHNMNNSMLSILESLSFSNLYSILYEYATMIVMENLTEDEVRFSFNNNIDPVQFPNITAVKSALIDKGLFVL